MPTYDYRCDACGHQLEAFQSMTAKPLRKCPECGKQKLKRLIGTGAGIIFKGSGFYETDYRSEGYKKAAEAEKNGDQSKSGSGEGKQDKSETAGSSSESSGGKSESTGSSSGDTGGKSDNNAGSKKKE